MKTHFDVGDIKAKWLEDQKTNSGYRFNIEREIAQVEKTRRREDQIEG